jgi:hypothetical protein
MKLNNARQAKGSASGTKKRRFMTKFPTMPPASFLLHSVCLTIQFVGRSNSFPLIDAWVQQIKYGSRLPLHVYPEPQTIHRSPSGIQRSSVSCGLRKDRCSIRSRWYDSASPVQRLDGWCTATPGGTSPGVFLFAVRNGDMRQETFGEAIVKRCAHCQGKLGLGVRFRNLWNGSWWHHLRFCSRRCEDSFSIAPRRTPQWHAEHPVLARASERTTASRRE